MKDEVEMEMLVSDISRLRRLYGEDRFPVAMSEYIQARYNLKEERKKEDTSLWPPEARKIIEAVLAHFLLTWEQLVAKNRKRRVVYPRQLCIYLLLTRTTIHLTEVGFIFGSDHTMPLYCRDTIIDLMETDEKIKKEVEYLNAQL